MLDLERTTLLLTGCIKPCQNVFDLSLKDEATRLNQYCESIKWAIDTTLLKNIVFIDNSNCAANNELVSYAKEKHKNLEWLSFRGDEKLVALHGKGYGEGEIIEYGICKSLLMQKSQYICKLTGRLRIQNIDNFLTKANMDSCYFWTLRLNRWRFKSTGIETRFYGVPVKIYEDIFMNAYKDVDDQHGNWLENEFYKRYCAGNLQNGNISFYPDFSGQSGTMGIEYKLSRQQLAAKTIATMLGLYKPRK